MSPHATCRWVERFRGAVLAGVAVSALLAGMPATAAETQVLAAGQLRVEIEVATERDALEFGPRFDRTAVVRSVTMDGVELLGPWGLADEFGLFGDGVLGYEAAAGGGAFMKIGIGRLLRDTDSAYEFSHPYPVEALFPVAMARDDTSLAVTQQSEGEGPWQYRYRKTYELQGEDGLTIHYELTNTGTTAWTFEHYNHHWFRLADVPVGPGYQVVTGFELPDAETGLGRSKFTLAMTAPLGPGEAAYYASDLVGIAASANTFAWQVDGQAVVRYQGSFAPARFALYADARGFCPEVFMRTLLAPGESAAWSATYRYNKVQ